MQKFLQGATLAIFFAQVFLMNGCFLTEVQFRVS